MPLSMRGAITMMVVILVALAIWFLVIAPYIEETKKETA